MGARKRMSLTSLLSDLHAATPLIAPSLLACDFAHLADEIRRVEEAGARMLHLDVMDGHFVPNMSIGVPIVEAVRRSTRLPLDVHLMISEPARYLQDFRDAGADLLTIHIETVADPRPLLEQIRDLGAGAGLSLNPPTPLETVEPYVSDCDLILVMSVMPGFGGQKFDPVALEKLRRLRTQAGPEFLLSVDGGVNGDTIDRCAQAGANVFVAGTAVFHQPDYRQSMSELVRRAKVSINVHV